MATHCSILVWRIPWTEEPGGLQSMASQRVRHNWVTNTHTHTHTRPAARYASSLSENTRQWVQASYHGSLLSRPAHQGMEISVHMFLKALWERSVGLHGGHNGRLCHKERIWAGRQQQSCWTQSLSAKTVGENHVLDYRASSLGKVEHFV